MKAFLKHHGVLGMKWGIRRYQPYSTVPRGSGKSGIFVGQTKEFKETVKRVGNSASNQVTNFSKQPISLPDVKKRGQLTNREAIECGVIAEKLFSAASKKEPAITNDVVDAVSKTGNSMYGLEYRLKQPTSMAAKIGQDAKSKDISFSQAASKIKDQIRYTAILNDKTFVNDYKSIKKNLEAKGYSETDFKNYYNRFNKGQVMHKAIQSNFTSKDGQTFELQYHTKSSQAAKELKIPIYEERRKSGISKTKALSLEKKMRDLAYQVPDPDYITDLLEKISL